MVNTNCRPAVVQVHKVSGTRETTPLDKVNQRLQMTSAKANNDACNDAQVNEEPPQQPLPPTKPDDDYLQFMKSSNKKSTQESQKGDLLSLSLSATPTPIITEEKDIQQQDDIEEDFTNMYYPPLLHLQSAQIICRKKSHPYLHLKLFLHL